MINNLGFDVVRPVCAKDLNPDGLLQKGLATLSISWYNPDEPLALLLAGINTYQEQVKDGDVVSDDHSAMSSLKERDGPYSNLAQAHHTQMVDAVTKSTGGNLSEPTFCCLLRPMGTGIKCMTILADDVNDDGETVTLEHCLVSCHDFRALAASAGEIRLTNSIAGMNYFLDPSTTLEQRSHVKSFFENRIHGESAVNNPDLMLFVCRPRNRRTPGTVMDVSHGPRYNTKPGMQILIE